MKAQTIARLLLILLLAACDSPERAASRPRCETLAACTEASDAPAFSPPVTVAPSGDLPAEVVSQTAHNNLDIAWFGDRLFFVFRTAPSHFAAAETVLYVVSTTDQKHWRYEGRFHMETDLREPRLLALGDHLYSSPFDRPDLTWLQGQTAETFIYRTTLYLP